MDIHVRGDDEEPADWEIFWARQWLEQFTPGPVWDVDARLFVYRLRQDVRDKLARRGDATP